MSAEFCALTPNDFIVRYTPREFIFLEVYNDKTVYFANDRVIYGGKPYVSLVDGNTQAPDNPNQPPLWQPAAQTNNITYTDVQDAFLQAEGNYAYHILGGAKSLTQPELPVMNPLIFPPAPLPPPPSHTTQEKAAQSAFCLLVAHYLALKLYAAANEGGQIGVTKSASADSVSTSTDTPDEGLARDFHLTSYGRIYYSMIRTGVRTEALPVFV